jgi:hypothetical protein
VYAKLLKTTVADTFLMRCRAPDSDRRSSFCLVERSRADRAESQEAITAKETLRVHDAHGWEEDGDSLCRQGLPHRLCFF